MTLEGYGVLFGEARGLMFISIQKGIAVWRSASGAGPDVILARLLDVQSAYLVVLSSVDGLVNLIKVWRRVGQELLVRTSTLMPRLVNCSAGRASADRR